MEFLLTLREQGMDPEPLRKRPMRKREYLWLFEAYSLLNRSRQVGQMEFYIPMTEYEAYMNIVKMDNVEDRKFMVAVLTQVDATLLHDRYEKMNSQLKKK